MVDSNTTDITDEAQSMTSEERKYAMGHICNNYQLMLGISPNLDSPPLSMTLTPHGMDPVTFLMDYDQAQMLGDKFYHIVQEARKQRKEMN